MKRICEQKKIFIFFYAPLPSLVSLSLWAEELALSYVFESLFCWDRVGKKDTLTFVLVKPHIMLEAYQNVTT